MQGGRPIKRVFVLLFLIISTSCWNSNVAGKKCLLSFAKLFPDVYDTAVGRLGGLLAVQSQSNGLSPFSLLLFIGILGYSTSGFSLLNNKFNSINFV